MKKITWIMLALALILALTASRKWAEEALPETNFYAVANLGTLGGENGTAYGINNKEWIGGTADLPDNEGERAVLWLPNRTLDLGTFGGPNSRTFFGPNLVGLATGSAETSELDPNGEDFCGYKTYLICRAFRWQSGRKIPLPTFGGNNSAAVDINYTGEVVGAAETAVQEETCTAPQVLQVLPAVWKGGNLSSLPRLAGDPDGGAITNNDAGEIAGYSGDCNAHQEAHALLWKNGEATELPSLGGAVNNAPQDMNEAGDVVGFSDLSGDAATHAMLWRNGKATDLGTLPGDVSSYALGINNTGQIVGESCDQNNNCTAVLWQNGTMTDLNALVPAQSSLYLVEAYEINDHGFIVGDGYDQGSGQNPAYLLTPVPGPILDAAGLRAAQVRRVGRVRLPESARTIYPKLKGGVQLGRR